MTNDKRKTSKRLLKKKLLFLLILFGIFFLSCELLVRLTGIAPELRKQPYFVAAPGEIPYLLKKSFHFQGINRTKEFELNDKTNSLGFFDSEWSLKKPEGQFRILALGDSFTSGIGRKDALKYISYTEQQLKKQLNKDIDILNMGVPGFFPAAEALILKNIGLNYQPDMVLINFCPNDVIDSYRGLEAVALSQNNKMKAKHEKTLGPIKSQLYIYSHFCRWSLKKMVINKLPSRIKDDFNEVFKDKGQYEEQWLEIFQVYRNIKELCQKKNIPLIITYIPLPLTWHENYAEQRLAQFCKEENCIFVSTLPELAKLSKTQTIHYEKDGHYLDIGNKAIADKVTSRLIETLKEEAE